jgi:S-adenosylmethionine synthetase
MIRMSEMVLPGHPDKFCDQVADAIIAHTVQVDPEAYGQIEVATWSDQVWLSGGVCTSTPLTRSIAELVVETGQCLGYRDGNWIDATRYQVNSTVCQLVEDPRKWSRKVNDQAIVVGWAGYDAATAYLAPEHFAAHAFREALARSCQEGLRRLFPSR